LPLADLLAGSVGAVYGMSRIDAIRAARLSPTEALWSI
jgi:hypothetical protein